MAKQPSQSEDPLQSGAASHPDTSSPLTAPQPAGEVTYAPETTSADNTLAENDDASPGVTPRVVILCLALAVFFGYIIPVIDMKTLNTFLGAAHLPPGAIAVLLILLLVINPLLRLLSGKLAFKRNEILTVYITCLFSALVPGHGAENFFVTNIIGPFYFATRENGWLAFLEPHLRPWFTPALNLEGQYGEVGQSVVNGWFTGLRTGESIPWNAWLIPLCAWGVFIFITYFMLGCLSVMLRAQWGEREALSFPLLRLPLEMTEDVDRPEHGIIGRFFRNPMMWIGFAITVVIQGMNGLNFYYTDVPLIPLEINTSAMFTEAPWNQIGSVPMRVFPIVVGITYLLTSEVSLSLWFFFWLVKFELIAAYYGGFIPNTLPTTLGHVYGAGAKTFLGFQQIGCYLAYVGIVLWTGREHFSYIFRRATGRVKADPSEKKEAFSYPFAFWGFIVSFALVVAWSMAAGMSLHLALVMWGLYLVIAIALTRIVAEGGLLFVQQGWTPMGALGQMFDAGGNHWLLPAKSIVPTSVIQASMMTDLRAFIMPSFLQGFKLAHDRGIRPKPLVALIFAVSFITLAMSLWMNVRLGYENGGLQLDPWAAVAGTRVAPQNAADLMKGARDQSWLNWVWLTAGGVGTYALMLARSRFLWFPLHPMGFLVSLTYPMAGLWFSIFLGWLFKVSITRFGGSDTYRKTTPIFLGLALGDVAMMLFWLIVDGYFGRTGHKLMPG
jgi:hypothetical protein